MCIDVFRAAGAPDAEAIARLVNAAYRPVPGDAGWTHEADLVSGHRTTAAQVLDAVDRPDSVVFVALRDAEIVACVHVEKHDDDSHIGMLAVHPQRQAAGLGKHMLALAEDHAVMHFGAQRCLLAVLSARQELIAFYLRRGYRKTGQVMDYPLDAGFGTPRQADLHVVLLAKCHATD
jgi:ribosomal protein S18 acetylase RimI-like enzyme